MDFIDDKADERDGKWKQIVDGAEDYQRGKKLSGREEWPEQDYHQTLEHAHASRHVTRKSEELCTQESAEHCKKGCTRRQQHIKDSAGQCPIHDGNEQLRGRQLPIISVLIPTRGSRAADTLCTGGRMTTKE